MDDALTATAREAQTRAHAPYSRFPVGAALEAKDGRVFVGTNVENASFGLTNCAERVALGAAVTAGVRHFSRLVIVTVADPPAAPCGACRQVLAEFCDGAFPIVSVGPSGTTEWTLDQLLPDRFGPASLEM